MQGVVQGVGFRPFVYRLAHELALAGWVNNDGAGVTIEVEGDPSRIDEMKRRLTRDAPPLARIERIAERDCVLRAESGFAIRESVRSHATTAIGPDSAICSDCLAELFDPGDRRYRYAFINCTHCGPRYTITRSLPYDRATTSMAAFRQCRECAAEYRESAASPLSRRAQRLPPVRPAARSRRRGPVVRSTARIRSPRRSRACAEGEIVAIKGLGGFHLACDARNGEAVARLRARKAREEKPFAVMAANAASLSSLAIVDPNEHSLLNSAERPIVLLRKRGSADASASRRCPRARVARRNAAVYAAAIPAVPRGGGSARGHGMARRCRRISCS